MTEYTPLSTYLKDRAEKTNIPLSEETQEFIDGIQSDLVELSKKLDQDLVIMIIQKPE